MIDDWSPPTGEYEWPSREPADAAPPGPRPDGIEVDLVFGITDGDLRMVDAFLHEVDLEVAAAAPPTPPATLDRLRASFERLKAMTPEEQDAERERLRRLDR